MLDEKLATALGVAKDSIPEDRLKDFSGLASQTTPEERASLYAATRYAYTGEGEIWDIGCAAGGSSFCLAAGLQDRPGNEGQGRIRCFDLFDGYSGNSFKGKFATGMSDLDIFAEQTRTVQDHVTAVQMNLVTDLDAFEPGRPVEIAHIDAAKSLPLWQSIFRKISAGIIPGKTIWIFQDFERARLPWQVYSLAELIKFGEIIGGASYGSLYFRFDSVPDPESRRKIIDDDFGMEERNGNVRSVFDEIRAEHMDIFPETEFRLDDLENTVLAYCHYWQKDRKVAREILENTSPGYLSHPYNRIYAKEILESPR